MRVFKRGGRFYMDATIQGARHREALETTDHREAKTKAQDRLVEIKAGKGASKSGKDFARKPFGEAAEVFIEERRVHVSERTHQLDRERLRALRVYFGKTPLSRIRAEDIAAYQRGRLDGSIRAGDRASKAGVGPRTANMELAVLRQMLKRGRCWNRVAEDVRPLPESGRVVGRALSREDKVLLFQTAASEDRWLVAFCAAVLAANTTCRGVELKGLRWRDVDLFARTVAVRRSKTEAGHRTIPLTSDAMQALSRLRGRAEAFGPVEPEHYVFAACENLQLDPTRPQRSWRTAWRSLVKEAARRAENQAVEAAHGTDAERARQKANARAAFEGLRFHDLRHLAVTELAEAGASDATLMSLAGHMSRRMLEHYSHVRLAAKREAVAVLDMGLMGSGEEEMQGRPTRPN